MKRILVLAAVAVLAFTACGGGGGGNGGEGDFSKATTAAITGVSTDADFANNGRFTVGFVAADADGNPILADDNVAAQIVMTVKHGNWLSTTVKAEEPGLTCSITAPGSTACTLGSLTSTKPSGDGKIVGATLIDDSGSMGWNDPDGDRGDAAKAFLDAACAETTNMFGVFDFGAGQNLTFTDTRDLLTADGVTDADLQGAISALPYAECVAANVTLAKAAITNQIIDSGGTPLYESVLELCQDLVAKHAAGGQLEDRALAMLVLSDGVPNDDFNKTAAQDCARNNGVTLCTVGLGAGSELDPAADPAAVQALKDLANAGSCVYAAATDAEALAPIFTAIGTAVSTGQNFAVYALNPVPTTGTTVEGTLTVGSATATFSFIAP